jgi:hypothetical protein
VGTKYVTFPTDLFLYIYEVGIMQGLQRSRSHNFIIHNIADLFSLNNSKFYDYAHCIYLTKLEIKETTDIARSTSYLDLHIDIDSKGWLRTKL